MLHFVGIQNVIDNNSFVIIFSEKLFLNYTVHHEHSNYAKLGKLLHIM